jgi:hypothetical protein
MSGQRSQAWESATVTRLWGLRTRPNPVRHAQQRMGGCGTGLCYGTPSAPAVGCVSPCWGHVPLSAFAPACQPPAHRADARVTSCQFAGWSDAGSFRLVARGNRDRPYGCCGVRLHQSGKARPRAATKQGRAVSGFPLVSVIDSHQTERPEADVSPPPVIRCR